ncbi:MAG TPA: hypothetical protein V6D12_21610, partial [Candidatus Obscuribacterales bacterium]
MKEKDIFRKVRSRSVFEAIAFHPITEIQLFEFLLQTQDYLIATANRIQFGQSGNDTQGDDNRAAFIP